ncbi:DUF4339 domain-containing protein [Granulicella cerasi]|uniref:DUF4339 domain-containing protein n=1 Tax=Granulicella cerasi TaxID=741063 RepID=A0ABW1Z944_9BACT|nr:DUF4339 domain-containing protein [Granulicella cerasi]
MNFRIARNGQIFGPYTEEDVRRYMASGNILPTDLAQAEGTEDWLPVAELFPPAPLTGQVPPTAYPGGLPRLFPDPPDLPWWVVLLGSMFTLGLFTVVWGIVQSGWLRRIDRTSISIYLYLANAVIFCLRLPSIFHSVHHNVYGTGIDADPHRFLQVIAFVLFLLTRFMFRSELLKHFNEAEPIGLRLGGVMTFFFGVTYFQYHFNRINELKRALRVSVPE